ncbi:MAG: hypoxanthine phosphoribosyltransferase [Bradymonadales bacterium]|nr:MAG: hypoxanthine phosphoribosyltransferase [Bradymonadales bacterium]
MTESMKVLISETQIQDRVASLGSEVSATYKALLSDEEPLLVIPVLSGSFVFAADLVRELSVPSEIDFIQLKSYEGSSSSGKVEIVKDIRADLKGRNCLIVEDIVDTGLTASFLLESLGDRKPKSLKLCSFLHKPSREEKKVPIDFLGFSIEDHFVVGYGLDFNGRWRHLKEVVIYEGGQK